MVFNMKLPRFLLLSIHNHLVYGGFIRNTNKNNPLREIKGLFFIILHVKQLPHLFRAIRAGIWPPIMVKIVLITIKIIP